MDKIGIIILAAGGSSRLGRPKQLLPFGGKTLLAKIVDEALQAALSPVVVVTGAFASEVEDSIKDLPVAVAHNALWTEGMASGIVAGLAELLSAQPKSRGVIVAVCDQPYLSAAVLRELVDKFGVSEKGMVASAYGGTMGTPVLFAYRYFGALAGLSGADGAKKLLKAYPEDVAAVEFPGGEVDIDTEGDLGKWG